MNNKVEVVADKIHQLWMSWAKTMLISEPHISEDRRLRWEKECMMPYSELSEIMKEYDRVFAREIIELIEKI